MNKFVKLTRAELKEILGGVVVAPCHSNCQTDDDCKAVEGETCKDDSSSVCPRRTNCG
jgi:hypothetical protein